MDSILSDRLLALVRPGNDLVLRRIRNLKRCAQACGCKITTPRYACNLAPGCISSEVKLCERKPPFFSGPLFLGPLVFFCLFFLSLAKVGLQPGAKLQAYLGVVILQPHACAQRFRFRILRRATLRLFVVSL